MASVKVARNVLFFCASASVFSLVVSGSNDGFLSVRANVERSPVDLLAQLEELDRVGTQGYERALELRADRLEKAIGRFFQHAPKDRDGLVSPETARYALHRLFVERHGWSVVGVDMNAGRDTARTYEALHSGGRFSLRQLARFAATLETLIHSENVERLEKVFAHYNYTKSRALDVAESMTVIESYMAHFFTTNVVTNTSYNVGEALEIAKERVLFPQVSLFGEEVRSAVFVDQDMTASGKTLWDACLGVVEEIGERYGKWQDRDCKVLKNKLLELETPETGRVPLSVFWDSVVQGKEWQFVESVPYLTQLGALQGSEPPHHSVIIPNYLYSNGNCFSHSKYYDTCCIDECNTLLGAIESQVDEPSVEPHRLVEIVSSLPSSTVNAPRVLKPELATRLKEIAARYNGVVPLHGRLFAQFLHHAYPRECPYPAASTASTASNASADTSMHRTEFDKAQMTIGEMKVYIDAAADEGFTDAVSYASKLTELPWSDEEELFMASVQVEASFPDQFGRGLAMAARGLVLAFGVAATAAALWSGAVGAPKKGVQHGVFV